MNLNLNILQRVAGFAGFAAIRDGDAPGADRTRRVAVRAAAQHNTRCEHPVTTLEGSERPEREWFRALRTSS